MTTMGGGEGRPGSRRRTVLRTAVAGGLGAAGLTAGARPAHAEDGGGRTRVSILLYDGFTALDAVGPYEVLCRVPGVEVTTVACERGPVPTDTGELSLVAARAMREVRRTEVLLIPGGGNRGTLAMMEDEGVHAWIRRLHRHTRWTTSVCTGSLILGAAGLLRGLPATTYWASRPYLEKVGATYTPGRFVEAGKVLTGAGVSAGMDMALHLTSRIADARTAQAVQLGIEYDPDPPYDTGSPEKADEELEELALKLIDDAAR
ncbi:DJ-1/PfpI family protein [Streptomyces sp. NPDC048172]|uniref:DJ-1/PfpI family protein n=1 Tax=Streptomyces sp. NPDC048172 TaxID=3365505 RepID=UPI00371D03EB